MDSLTRATVVTYLTHRAALLRCGGAESDEQIGLGGSGIAEEDQRLASIDPHDHPLPSGVSADLPTQSAPVAGLLTNCHSGRGLFRGTSPASSCR
jgi:hypothetical protein